MEECKVSNIAQLKLGIVAVSRDRFPMELSIKQKTGCRLRHIQQHMGTFMNVLQQLKVKYI